MSPPRWVAPIDRQYGCLNHELMTTTAVTPALITASASVLIAAVVFVANLVVQFRNERRQVALARVNAQLRELYGPLYAQYEVSETIWRALRDSGLPGREVRRAGTATDAQRAEWRLWVQEALMPGNVKMRDAVIEHADLRRSGAGRCHGIRTSSVHGRHPLIPAQRAPGVHHAPPLSPCQNCSNSYTTPMFKVSRKLPSSRNPSATAPAEPSWVSPR